MFTTNVNQIEHKQKPYPLAVRKLNRILKKKVGSIVVEKHMELICFGTVLQQMHCVNNTSHQLLFIIKLTETWGYCLLLKSYFSLRLLCKPGCFIKTYGCLKVNTHSLIKNARFLIRIVHFFWDCTQTYMHSFQLPQSQMRALNWHWTIEVAVQRIK